MKTNRNNAISSLFRACLLGGSMLLAVACNDTMPDTLRYDYPQSGSNYQSGHVLLIILDGASGRAVQTARNAYKTPALKSMAEHALYTDYGLGDNTQHIKEGKMTNARGWANLMIGNTTHGVKTEEDLSSVSQSFVSRLVNEEAGISIYAADDKFRQVFALDGMNSPVLTTDQSVKDRVLEELNNTVQVPSDLIVAEFKGVNEVGKDKGFYDENGIPTEDVVNAISVLDGYVAEMWESLKARPNFLHENWLVIVTSNYGGEREVVDVSDHYDDLSRNTFTLMYNERLLSQVQGRPGDATLGYTYYTPMWGYDKDNANPTLYAESARLGNNDLGGFGNVLKGSSTTIQFFMKSDMATSQKYVILSKSADITDNGWSLYFNDSNKRMCLTFGSKRGIIQYADYKNIDWTEWHTVTITVQPDPKKVNNTLITLYLDGVQNGETSVTNKNVESYYYSKGAKGNPDEVPFRIGATENRDSQNNQNNTKNQSFKNYLFITNVQVYDVAIPAEDIAKYSGKNILHILGESYPYWENLRGYWPCDLEADEQEPILKDYSKYRTEDGTSDFLIDRGSSKMWTKGTSKDAAMHPIPESDKQYYYKTFNIVDVSRQIFLWLGKNISWDWDMEGKAWQLIYTDMVDEN